MGRNGTLVAFRRRALLAALGIFFCALQVMHGASGNPFKFRSNFAELAPKEYFYVAVWLCWAPRVDRGYAGGGLVAKTRGGMRSCVERDDQ